MQYQCYQWVWHRLLLMMMLLAAQGQCPSSHQYCLHRFQLQSHCQTQQHCQMLSPS
jgi:hypothetical protein